MTEPKIFEILLQKQYDFPKLHEEAASTIANSFTDIICDTLKLKSSLPTSKRLNVLKFLKTLASNSDSHVNVNEKNYHSFIQSCQEQFESDDLNEFLDEVDLELQEQLPRNLSCEIQEFYRKKSEARQRNIKRLEIMKKYDQEALDEANFPAKITRNISYYETSETLIKKLLSDSQSTTVIIKPVDFTDFRYREKQMKFAYGILHLREWATLEKILDRLRKYKQLTNHEINFLTYLNEHVSGDGEHLRQFLVENFIFIYEKSLTDFCTKIIQLEDDQVLEFLENLLFDKKFLVIKQLCVKESFKLKMTELMFELYSYSFCNRNLLKLVDFLL